MDLYPCHYFSSPELSWDAMLKMTGVKLVKISDIKKYLFIEKGLRGGISYIAKRRAKANNKYMNDFDHKKPSTFIHDMNNLYSWAMREYLPYEGFELLRRLMSLERCQLVNAIPLKKVQYEIFLRLTLNILMNYMSYTMIIH